MPLKRWVIFPLVPGPFRHAAGPGRYRGRLPVFAAFSSLPPHSLSMTASAISEVPASPPKS